MIRLLICDDSPEARTAVRAMLAEEGQVEIVAEASNGAEAIALALHHQPDVVLMDVAMPIVDGIQATERIRELLPSIRIVAFAGSDENDTIAAMLEAGANAYCVKGAPLWELQRAVVGATDPLMRLAHGLSKAVNGGGGAAGLVARELADLSGASFVAVYLAAPDVGLSLAGANDVPTSPASVPEVAWRSFSDASLAHADAHELAELWHLGCACAEAAAAPLVVDGEALGVILVAMPPSVQLSVDEELLAAVADLAAPGLASVRRMALTYAEARRDALTGLANRRAFDEHLEELRRRAEQEPDLEVSIILMDVDDFKQVNDRHGHLVGDEVLRELSRIVLRAVRADEEAFRIGGEELAIVVEDGSATAKRVAERIREAIAGHRRGRKLPTVSAGVASFRPAVEAVDEAVRRADEALYAAKDAGKNCVVAAGTAKPITAPPAPVVAKHAPVVDETRRILVVDDDDSLRILLRTTFEVVDIEVDEAGDADNALRRIESKRPDVIVLDVGLPGTDGLELCRQLKGSPATSGIAVVLLTGSDEATKEVARAAGADALLGKPFSPLELLAIVERLAGGLHEGPFRAASGQSPEEQLLLYAQDLRRLREIERGQRILLQRAYRQTVSALATALESKDMGTGAHSQRVQRYAIELATALEPSLLDDPSVEYGFLLHDVGKIGIPDRVLQKPATLTAKERRLMETHTTLGAQMLGEVSMLQGEGLRIVRSHHERWDGRGYPDALTGEEIPLGARIFAVADALDAMTSHRPYREAGSWDEAVAEIIGEAGQQFDPKVVGAFSEREARLRRVYYELTKGETPQDMVAEAAAGADVVTTLTRRAQRSNRRGS
jgi:ribonuclease P protein subunit RPR2